MFKNLTNTQKGIALALLGYSGFSISDASAKFLIGSYPVLLIVAYIMAAASIVLLLSSPWIGGFKKPAPGMARLHILRTIMNFLISVMIVYAFKNLQLTTAYTIVFAMPFIATLLAILIYREKVTAARWTALALGFTGVLIAMRPTGEGFDFALLLPLGAAFCLALKWIVSRSMQGESLFCMGFFPVAGTTAITLPLIWNDLQIPATEHFLLFVICGIGIATGVIALSIAYRSTPSAAVAPMHYSQMIWGLVFGYVIFSDLPDLWMMLGAAIIIGSGIYLIEKERSGF
ncbi:MAG: membrane protein [Micavibrio sp.]|nr:MAG: membrane protein [Micavibrio sp.]